MRGGAVVTLAQRLRHEAEVARTSPYGMHPDIGARTAAAALLWAAKLVEEYDRPRPRILNCDGAVHRDGDLRLIGECDGEACRPTHGTPS